MKVKLRAIQKADSPLLYKWINDPEIIKYTNYFHPVPESEHEEWLNSIHKKKNQTIFGIEHNEKKELLGICGLYEIDFISRKAELRIKIGNKDYWGKGLGTEAVNLLLRYGFTELNLNRIWLKVLKDNFRAVKSYKKIGFIEEGLLRKDMFINNCYNDVLVMSILKNEFINEND